MRLTRAISQAAREETEACNGRNRFRLTTGGVAVDIWIVSHLSDCYLPELARRRTRARCRSVFGPVPRLLWIRAREV